MLACHILRELMIKAAIQIVSIINKHQRMMNMACISLELV